MSDKFKAAKRYGVSELVSELVSEWVSDKHSQWSDSGPIKTATYDITRQVASSTAIKSTKRYGVSQLVSLLNVTESVS